MKKPRILIVDDEPYVRRVCAETLQKDGNFVVFCEGDSEKAADRFATESFDMLLTDLNMPAIDGIDLLKRAKAADPDLIVVVLTGYPTIETAVETMKLGAADYLTKPFLPDDLLSTVTRLLENAKLSDEHRLLSRQVSRPFGFEDFVGESAAMRKVFELIDRVAASDVGVLVIGETGTGKELVARALHSRSKRASERFVPVNCGAIPENLMESEFFGHERGAFTGADLRTPGLVEYSDRGTFFMDEIAELPMMLQSKLLRVLQEKSVRRLGGKDEIPVDVRVVAATAVDLEQAIAAKRFRQDLYYRLNVVQIDLPPLRERGDDVLKIADYFVGRFSQESGREIAGISAEAREVLQQYRWPGNIRELQNVIRRAIAMANTETIEVDDLPDALVSSSGARVSGGTTGESLPRGSRGSFFEAREVRINHFEREYLAEVLTAHQGDVAAAAREAQIPRGTYYRLMKKHGINATEFRR